MIEVIVRVPASAVMTNPAVVLGMNVRSLGMSLGIVKFTVLVLCRRRMCRSPHRCGTVRRNMTSADAMFEATARRGGPVGRCPTSMLSIKRQ
jgi:hypothetical protein